jgi:hypothetical protein
MTAAIIVGDVHIAERSPSSRRPTYKDEILDKLRFCVDEANRRNAPLVQAGDMFHLKPSSKNSHRLVQEVHEILSQTYNGAWIVPGNHDLSHDRLDSLDGQPLGALCRMENVNLLVGETVDLPGIAGVPYITEFDGGDWQHAMRDCWEDFGILAEEPTLLVTHAPLFPPGEAPGVYASIEPDYWSEFWIGIVATYYGHIHDYHGTYMSPNQLMQFCNQGALSRGSLHESTVTRKPAITFWDGTDFNRIEVPHKAPEEVFLFDEAAKKAANQASAEDFAKAIGSTKLRTLTIEQVYSKLRTSVSNREVLTIIEQILEELQ